MDHINLVLQADVLPWRHVYQVLQSCADSTALPFMRNFSFSVLTLVALYNIGFRSVSANIQTRNVFAISQIEITKETI
jgi:hypothetical protein